MDLPVLTAIRALRHTRDRLTLAALIALSVYSAIVVMMPVSARARELAMRRFHAAGWSFAGWAMLQPLPWMYNFENRLTVTPERSDQPQCRARSEFVNHQPYGRFFTPHDRYWYRECGPARVRFSSTYRGLTIETGYSIAPAPSARGLIVRPDR
jgi:hypothetical protein